jgi:biopolymer transport protein ExbD
MRRPVDRGGAKFGLDVKMAPMIDVIFQLLIFFLCTAGFTAVESVLPTTLPRMGALAAAPPRPHEDVEIVRIELSGDESGVQIRMNGRALADDAELFARLKLVAGVAPRTPVVLDVAPTVPVGRAVDVYDGVLSAGLASVHFAARRKSPAGQ